MIVKKTKDKLYIYLEDEKNYEDIITSDELFWNDLNFHHSHQDGWMYLYDANRNQVIMLDNYYWCALYDLLEQGYVELGYCANGEDYEDYEWNEM